jgi:nucleotide-binding universal stress UspA family protein
MQHRRLPLLTCQYPNSQRFQRARTRTPEQRDFGPSQFEALRLRLKAMKPGTVLVGVDGSAESVAALRLALQEANLRNASVRVLHQWEAPPGFGPEMFMTQGLEAYRHSGEKVLQHTIAEATDGLSPLPPISSQVCDQSAAVALVEESQDAELLVVGNRGHGGFIGLLLGSVASQVLNHAKCPVVVVPSKK